jgi:C-terminal processing protease CtpA/Prc
MNERKPIIYVKHHTMPLLFVLLFTLIATGVFGQGTSTATPITDSAKTSVLRRPLSKQEVDHLFVLGKLWGFLKYHHPAVAKGKFNWDKELTDIIPVVMASRNKQQRSDSLLAWINRLGDVPLCDSCKDSTFKDVALRPDHSWINKANFSAALMTKLIYINANRIRGDQYYIRFGSEDDIHVAAFEHENAYGSMTYPAPEYRLLALLRYWNMIEYWYPYKYDLGQSWDNVLKRFIPQVVAADNARTYTVVMQQVIASILDGHAGVQSKIVTEGYGVFQMPFTVKFIEQKAVIVTIINDSLARQSGINRGDIIESIDGITVKELIRTKRQVISASNEGGHLNFLRYILTRSRKESSELLIRRGAALKKVVSFNAPTKALQKAKPGTFPFERDSSLCIIQDSIGYVNLGNFQRKDSTKWREMVSKVKGLIIDNRQYPKTLSAGDLIGNAILSPNPVFVKFSSPHPDQPGLFPFSKPTGMGTTGTTGYIPPKIAILINEETQSSIEFQAMLFRRSPGAVLIGSRTAGADGNVALINLPGGIITYISGLGVYYPDGIETQRVGIIPDIEVKPTIKGFLNNKDELLDKAVEYIKEGKAK